MALTFRDGGIPIDTTAGSAWDLVRKLLLVVIIGLRGGEAFREFGSTPHWAIREIGRSAWRRRVTVVVTWRNPEIWRQSCGVADYFGVGCPGVSGSMLECCGISEGNILAQSIILSRSNLLSAYAAQKEVEGKMGQCYKTYRLLEIRARSSHRAIFVDLDPAPHSQARTSFPKFCLALSCSARSHTCFPLCSSSQVDWRLSYEETFSRDRRVKSYKDFSRHVVWASCEYIRLPALSWG